MVFLPGATCLFDILDKDGYNQSFMIGTTREYAGTDKYLETHSNPKILDWIFYSKRDNLDDDSDPKRKRIIRDEKLFSYAKSEIIDLYQKEKPFAFVMMTLDTHFGNEHFDKENCIVKYHDDNIKDGHVQHACIWMHGCLTLYFQNEFSKYPQYFSL